MWISVLNQLPPEGVLVETKIENRNGVQCERRLSREGKLWFLESGVHVYNPPTHWKLL